jgi:hypothetical protein
MSTDQTNRRFIVGDNRNVVDRAYPRNGRKYKYYGDPSDSDSDIRVSIFAREIRRLLPKLIVGSKGRPIRWSLANMIDAAIRPSQINSSDPLLALQHPFNGKLRSKEGMSDYTSISLFMRDVERLLRELYGDLDRAEFDMTLCAIREIVLGFVSFVRPELRAEYYDADSIDYAVGIGRPEGYGLSSSQHGAASMASIVLAVRKLQVFSDPTAHAPYTIRFVKALNKHWPKLGGIDCGTRTETIDL